MKYTLIFAFALAPVRPATLRSCEEPFCEKRRLSCASIQVSTCHVWPHWCSTLIHGPYVYCSKDHRCLCGQGTCAAAQDVCRQPPLIPCEKNVSTCEVWPH